MFAALLALVVFAASSEPANNSPALEPAPAIAPVAAPKAPATPSDAMAKLAERDDKVICKNEQVTGTMFVKKVCRTAAQIRAQREESRKTTADIQTNSAMAPGR